MPKGHTHLKIYTFKIEVQSQEWDEEDFRQGERIPGA